MTTLKRVLTDGDRSYMHEELCRYLLSGTYKDGDGEGMAADLVREDPSLLTDSLVGAKFGPPVRITPKDGGRPRALGTSGNWCMVAAQRKLPVLLEVALRAGVSPDDPDVFLQGGLLSYRSWSQELHLLELALKYGAQTDVDIQPAAGSRVWAGAPAQVAFRNALVNSRNEAALIHLRTVHRLLSAGTKMVGYVRVDGPTESYPSAAWELADATWWREDVAQQAVAIVPLFRSAGVDIDISCGKLMCPPVVAAARRGNLELARAFIAAGCQVEDVHIVRPASGRTPAVETLEHELNAGCGPGAGSVAVEALMKVRMERALATASEALSDTAPSRRRHRARMV